MKNENSTASNIDVLITNTENPPHLGFFKIEDIIKLLPIGKSTWWKGVQTGKFPRPIKLGARTSLWNKSDVYALLTSLQAGEKC